LQKQEAIQDKGIKAVQSMLKNLLKFFRETLLSYQNKLEF
jgi:hypothetical protein